MTHRIPFTPGDRLLGSARAFAQAPHTFVDEVARPHGLAEFRVLHRRFIAVRDAELVRHVLVTGQARYARSYHYRNPVIGDGLLTTDGPAWRKRRRQVQPAFHRETLAHVARATNRASDALLERWEDRRLRGEAVDVATFMSPFALSVIGQTLLSTDVDWAEATAFGGAIRRSLRLLRVRNTSILRLPPWVPTPLNAELAKTRRILDRFVRPIIEDRRQRVSSSAPPDLLASLMTVRDPESGEPLSDRAVLDEAKTLFTAGYETTASALTWALYLLAAHPEAAARWHGELDRVLGDRPPELDDLRRLEHGQRVLQEALRLYPPVYTVARECLEDDDLGGHRVPKGSVLLLSVWGVHRDGRLWDAPDDFVPDRFAGPWPQHAFLPFATGKHLCIGNHFALTEMAVALARIGQRYELERVDPTPVGTFPQITLIPDRPVWVRLVRRR